MSTAPSSAFPAAPLAPSQGQTILVSDLWVPADQDDAQFREAEASGRVRRLARRAHRFFFAGSEGSGSSDTMVPADGLTINVANCRLRLPARQVYLTDEPLIMLRASLACDTSYAVPGADRMVFRRPEVTLVGVASENGKNRTLRR